MICDVCHKEIKDDRFVALVADGKSPHIAHTECLPFEMRPYITTRRKWGIRTMLPEGWRPKK